MSHDVIDALAAISKTVMQYVLNHVISAKVEEENVEEATEDAAEPRESEPGTDDQTSELQSKQKIQGESIADEVYIQDETQDYDKEGISNEKEFEIDQCIIRYTKDTFTPRVNCFVESVWGHGSAHDHTSFLHHRQ